MNNTFLLFYSPKPRSYSARSAHRSSTRPTCGRHPIRQVSKKKTGERISDFITFYYHYYYYYYYYYHYYYYCFLSLLVEAKLSVSVLPRVHIPWYIIQFLAVQSSLQLVPNLLAVAFRLTTPTVTPNMRDKSLEVWEATLRAGFWGLDVVCVSFLDVFEASTPTVVSWWKSKSWQNGLNRSLVGTNTLDLQWRFKTFWLQYLA